MQGQTAVTGLAICFTAAAIAGLLGLSAAYGAFLAGLVIGNTFSHKKLEAHTKPIFEVMIMIFFLSIGLLIDLNFLKDHFVEIVFLLFITMFIIFADLQLAVTAAALKRSHPSVGTFLMSIFH